MRYYKFPKWLKRFYPNAVWDFFLDDNQQNTIYLTFDDGPTPEVTEWILDLLNQYNAKATFFCVGENVKKYPEIFNEIIKNGHAVGNHTMSHINGVKTSVKTYVKNIQNANNLIQSKLFRPPYGKMSPFQYKQVKKLGYKTVFWSHLSYDFDNALSSKLRIENVIKNLKPGAIIVFHDSFKAYAQLKKELPVILNKIKTQNYICKPIKF